MLNYVKTTIETAYFISISTIELPTNLIDDCKVM